MEKRLKQNSEREERLKRRNDKKANIEPAMSEQEEKVDTVAEILEALGLKTVNDAIKLKNLVAKWKKNDESEATAANVASVLGYDNNDDESSDESTNDKESNETPIFAGTEKEDIDAWFFTLVNNFKLGDVPRNLWITVMGSM